VAAFLPGKNSMNGKFFVDTNILIYAHDLDSGMKHDAAVALLRQLWESETGVLSTQVIQEFYVNVTRKIPHPLSPVLARGLIENYFAWPVIINGTETIRRASEIEERYRLSFWDALIIAAAVKGRADQIFTEDLKAGETIEGIQIVNPFL
jgi:predicted nucleic acid-binding protein